MLPSTGFTAECFMNLKGEMSPATPYVAKFIGIDAVFHGELAGRVGTATGPAYGENYDYVYFDCFGDRSVTIVAAKDLEPLVH